MIQTAEIPHQISLTVVEVGRNVTLECPVSETKGKFFYWYKQPLGYTIQRVVAENVGKLTISKQFNNSRFTATKRDAQYFLTITNISKEDEATYFCHYGATYSESFNGIFLAVNGKTYFTFSVCAKFLCQANHLNHEFPLMSFLMNHADRNQQKAVYVKQSPETESVQPGDSMTLQCSLLSKTKGNTDQCPGEHSVYWFRSGSGESHPGIIYTHSDEEEDRSCVYSLSKTIQNSSDTGTYYCAVVTCGEILFGEGTKVETSMFLRVVSKSCMLLAFIHLAWFKMTYKLCLVTNIISFLN